MTEKLNDELDPKTCRQPDICAEKFKNIDDSLERGETRMTRTETKIDKVLFRITAMIFTVLLFTLTVGIGFYKSHNNVLHQIQLSSAEIPSEKGDSEKGSDQESEDPDEKGEEKSVAKTE